MRSERIVSDSTPRARRAAALLPAKRLALTSTARSIGMPAHCVTAAPGPNPGALKPCATCDPTRCGPSLAWYSSIRNGR
jgi:hypothetical protein